MAVGADGSLPAELPGLIATMYETMDAAHGVGLAANQIGQALRLFVYDCADDRGETQRRRGVVINPVLETSEIPETMPDPGDDDEGCLSVPGESFPTGRAEWARVTGLNADGSPIAIEGAGLFARMLQHETGHLDGFLYLDLSHRPALRVPPSVPSSRTAGGFRDCRGRRAKDPTRLGHSTPVAGPRNAGDGSLPPPRRVDPAAHRCSWPPVGRRSGGPGANQAPAPWSSARPPTWWPCGR